MKEKFKLVIEEYQCSGCVSGTDTECFEANEVGGIGCGKHHAGTIVTGIGNVFLGMPTGFNRLGECRELKPTIYETFDSSDWHYDMWNVPVWKYKNKDEHTFVRGVMPRHNEPFLHIFLEDCLDKIECLEISQEDVDGMD